MIRPVLAAVGFLAYMFMGGLTAQLAVPTPTGATPWQAADAGLARMMVVPFWPAILPAWAGMRLVEGK